MLDIYSSQHPPQSPQAWRRRRVKRVRHSSLLENLETCLCKWPSHKADCLVDLLQTSKGLCHEAEKIPPRFSRNRLTSALNSTYASVKSLSLRAVLDFNNKLRSALHPQTHAHTCPKSDLSELLLSMSKSSKEACLCLRDRRVATHILGAQV